MNRPVTRLKSDATDYNLVDQVGHLLRRAHQRASSIFANEMAEAELTPLQFAALVQIGESGQVSQNALGRLTAMDPATVHGVISRLRDRKLVNAVADPDDRRRTLLSLSRAGERLLGEAIPHGLRITERTLDPLSSRERKQFLALLSKIATTNTNSDETSS